MLSFISVSDTSVSQGSPEEGRKIFLKRDCPLFPFNRLFPAGIPVKSSEPSLNIDGLDCYELNPETLPSETVLRRIALILLDERAFPAELLIAFFEYGVICIPAEWEEVTA